MERRGRTRGPATVNHRGGERWQVVAATARSAGLGLAWVAWPCGLLQSALLVAALANMPASGALVMAGFAGASAAGLLLGPALWWRLSGGASDLRVVFMGRPKNNNAHREWLVFSQPQRPQLAVARCLVVRSRRARSDVPRRWGNAASEESRPLNIQIGTNVQKNPLMNSGPPP